MSDPYLAPHPWDTLGPPPLIGHDYRSTWDPAAEDGVRRLLAEALRNEDDAHEKEQEADEAHDLATHFLAEARALIEREIRPHRPALADVLANEAAR